MYKLMFYLTIVNKTYITVTLGWHDSTITIAQKIGFGNVWLNTIHDYISHSDHTMLKRQETIMNLS